MRTGSRRPRTLDAAIAVGCWAISLGLMCLLPVLAGSDPDLSAALAATGSVAWTLTVVVLTVQAALLLVVRAAPRIVLLIIAAAATALAVARPIAIYDLSSLAIIVAVFRVVPGRHRRELSILLPVVALLVAAGELINDFDGTDFGADVLAAVLQGLVVVGLPALVSYAISARREVETARRHELTALSREHEALVRAAVADERTAMARELHDIAAHHLSGIILMAGAADRQIDADPDAAHQSVRRLRTQAGAVLDDLRQLVGLLRQNGGAAARSVETVATIPELVEERRAAGADVRLQTRPTEGGEPVGRGIGPLAQLVAYRMVQESLSNAAAHAPGAPCRVEIDDRDPAALVLTVINNAPATAPVPRPGGFGLIGMAERAAVVGAELHYGPRPDGGWQVRLTMPRDTVGAAGAPGIGEQHR